MPRFSATNVRLCNRTIAAAKPAILDTIGVTLAGGRHDGVRRLERVVLPTATGGPCLVFGSGRRLNALDAALINGMASHMLDYDDSNSLLHGHPSVAILPSLLAVAEERDASGAEVLRAYITGFEVACRLGMGVSRHQYTHGWHPTATVGIFAGTVASGLLIELTEAQLATAVGIAASLASGIKANFGSMTKPLHVGHAARNALMAVRLAREGFTSSPRAFDHPAGYMNVFDRGPENYNTDKIVSGWNDPPAIVAYGVKQKQFPCCYACLPPAAGLIRLMRDPAVTFETIDRIDVAVHPIRQPHIDNPHPANPFAAKFSLHYCMAQLARNGELTIEDFEDSSRIAPEVQALMQRTTLSSYERENIGGAEVRVTLRDGRLVEIYQEAALGGSADNPIPPDMLRAKFEDSAGRALDVRRVDALYEQLSALAGRGKRHVYDVLASAEARNLSLLYPFWSKPAGATSV